MSSEFGVRPAGSTVYSTGGTPQRNCLRVREYVFLFPGIKIFGECHQKHDDRYFAD
jgi:hypothetical protein